VYTARGKLRQRRRMRWLYFLLPEQQPELRGCRGPAGDLRCPRSNAAG
jgi:hypothetical protein